MAIDKTVEVLDAEIIEREDPIKEGWIQKAYKMASALYEGLFDATAPGDSSQAWSGHDHAQSGGPIARGCAWSEDGGNDAPLFTYEPTVAKSQARIDSLSGFSKTAGMARYYGSPLFEPYIAKLKGRLCYTAINSKFTLYFVETNGTATSKKSIEVSIELEETANESYPVWVDLPDIPLNPGKWNRLDIYGEADSYDSANAPSLKIYGIVLTEAPGLTIYGKSKLLSRLDSGIGSQASASGLAHTSFQPLEQTLVADEQPLDADTLSRVQWFANGLYEGVLDQRAPGTNTQTCRGHDHDDYGGLGITRNKVCSLSTGERGPYTKTIGMMGEHGTSSPSTGSAIWHLADEDTSAGGLRSTAGVAHMIGPVSPGITNTGTSTAPYLDAMAYITSTSLSSTNYTVRVAIYNRDQAAFSAVASFTTVGNSGGQWLYIDEIPCDDDQFNSFDIYVQCSDPSVTIVTHYVQISESALVDGSVVSQPESSATSGHLGVAP
jgi:hypothetical protein